MGENHYRVKIEQGRGAAHHPIYLWNVNVYDNKITYERIKNYDEKVRLFGLGFLSSIAVVVGIGLIPKIIGFFMVGSSIDFQMVLVALSYYGIVSYLYHSWKVTYKINSKVYIKKFMEIVSE